MSSRKAIFWLLIALLVTLAGNVYLILSPARKSSRQTNRELLDPDVHLNLIRIENPGAPAIELKFADGHWRMTEPCTSGVDEAAVMKLMDRFSTALVEDVLSEEELLKLGRTKDDFGFSAKSRKVIFAEDDDQYEFTFGSLSPSTNSVYVVGSEAPGVLLVNAELERALAVEVIDFRDRRLFSGAEDRIAEFSVKSPGEAAVSVRREGDAWYLGDERASNAGVKDFLNAIATARINAFIWPSGIVTDERTVTGALLASYGLDSENALSLSVKTMEGGEHRIFFGNEAITNHVYALVHDGVEIATVDSSLKSQLANAANKLRSSQLVQLEESKVASFTIADKALSYVVARDDVPGKWRMDSPVSAPADSDVVAKLLKKMLALTREDLAEEGWTISVNTNTAPLVVKNSVFADSDLKSLRSLEMIKIDPEFVKRIVVTYGEPDKAVVSLVYDRERKVWNVEKPQEGGAIDEQAIAELLKAVASLSAERVEAVKSSASEIARYGLEKPFCTIAIDVEKEGASRKNILIGGKADGGRFATIGSSDAIFVISRKTVSVLTEDLLDD